MDSILEGADMTNAVVDRVDFSRAKLKGAKFINAVVTGRKEGWGRLLQQGGVCCTPTAARQHPCSSAGYQ